MAGLLDMFDNGDAQFGLGLLAAAAPRADGAGFGQRLMEGVQYGQQWKKDQAKQKLYDLQMKQAQALMEEAQAKRERDAKISAGMAQFFKPGQQAIAPLIGDSSIGIVPSNGRAAVAPSFDAGGAAQFLAQNGDYEAALKYMPKPKESQINKFDVKDFTPQSVAKYSQTGNYADLVRMDKAHFANTGGETVAVDPFTGQRLSALQNTQSPDSKASNAVAWANNAIQRERLTFDKAGGAESAKPKLVDGQWVMAPSGMKPGESMPAVPSLKIKDALEAVDVIKMAKEIIPKATGSYGGMLYDQGARVFGKSTSGANAASQLKALEGALVSKMPKMSGPQSDKDVLLYRQQAGMIGDETIPTDQKLAALQVIETLQSKYAGLPTDQQINVPFTKPKTSGFKIISVD